MAVNWLKSTLETNVCCIVLFLPVLCPDVCVYVICKYAKQPHLNIVCVIKIWDLKFKSLYILQLCSG